MTTGPVKFNPKLDIKENHSPPVSAMAPETSGCAEKEPYALQVLGPEMEPDFPDGTIIIIEPYSSPIVDAFVVAEVDGEKWFRQYRQADQRHYLSATNPIFPDIELNQTEWRIIGIIRQRNIKRDIKHFEYPNE